MINNNFFLKKIFTPSQSKKNIIIYSAIIFLMFSIFYLIYNILIKVNFSSDENNPNAKLNSGTKIQVEVLNGAGISNISEKFTNYLRMNNIDVIQFDNYSSFDVDKSIVIDRAGKYEKAKKVADVLGISNDKIVSIINKNLFLDVSVIIGKDFNQLKNKKD